MKRFFDPDNSAAAERLLEQLFKAGANHYYIFDRMESLPELKAIVNAAPEVAVEILLRLMALISKALTSKQELVDANCAKLARDLIPGLKSWKEKRSDWLGSGAQRLPLRLVPLLLRKSLVCSDATFARLLEVCCVPRTTIDFVSLQPVIQAFVRQASRRIKTDGVGECSGKVLRKLKAKLAKLASSEISSLATWAKKQATAIEDALELEGG